jgi:hypothetical protein
MILPHYDLVMRITEQQIKDRLQKAERRRMLRQAGLGQRGWMSLKVCWLLYRLGSLLVALGQRLLERYEGPPVAPPVKRQRASGVSSNG